MTDKIGWKTRPGFSEGDEKYLLRLVYYEYEPDLPRYSCDVRWDGCIHFYQYCNGAKLEQHDPDDVDYIHICEIDELIEILQQIKARAVAHFKNFGQENWPDLT